MGISLGIGRYTPPRTYEYLKQPSNPPSDRNLRLFVIECYRRRAEYDGDSALMAALDAFGDSIVGMGNALQVIEAFEQADSDARHIFLALTQYRVSNIDDVLDGVMHHISDTICMKHNLLPAQLWSEIEGNRPRVSVAREEFLNQRQTEDARFLALAKDLFENAHHSIKLNESWRTSTVIGLAETMYTSRDFGAMPILADALEDAGCEDAAILSHCRDPHGVHVRGCWVVDLVLGKS